MSAITDSTSGETGDVFEAVDTIREAQEWFAELNQRTTEVATIQFTARTLYSKEPQIHLLGNVVGSDLQFYGSEVAFNGQFQARVYTFNENAHAEAKSVIDQTAKETQKLVQRNPFYTVEWDLEAYDNSDRLLCEKHWKYHSY